MNIYTFEFWYMGEPDAINIQAFNEGEAITIFKLTEEYDYISTIREAG